MILPARHPLYGNPATVTDMHLQLVSPQEPHPDPRIGVCFIDEDLATLPSHKTFPGVL